MELQELSKGPIKVDVVNVSPPAARGAWIVQIISVLLVPLAIATLPFIASRLASEEAASTERSKQSGAYVELSVSILQQSAVEADSASALALRKWAVDLLSSSSPVPLTEELQKQLEQGTVALPTAGAPPVAVAATQRGPVTDKSYKEELMVEARFDGVDLSHVSFDGAKLARPHFYAAKLNVVSFRGSSLQSADFRRAMLTEVDFSSADLFGADFDEAKGLETVRWSPTTVCPDGVKAGESGCLSHLLVYPWNGKTKK